MIGVAVLLLAYLATAYLIVPLVWEDYIHRHPQWDDLPGITRTATGIPADPINVALVGTRAEIDQIARAAGWDPADSITLRSSAKIAADTVLNRPYVNAPVSSLYLYGRKHDLAFEKPVGNNPRRRHHVRFWKSEETAPDGRPVWLGAATYDLRVGLSHTTGEVTHHIGPDVDAERDEFLRDLADTGLLRETRLVKGFHEVHQGRNGGGDRWRTDGDLGVAVINPDGGP